MILVDSSVWIDYFRGALTPETDRLHGLLGSEELLTGDLILTEVLQGFDSDRDFNQARRLLLNLKVIDIGGYEVAIQAALNYRTLRALGITVRKTIDTIIATRCILESHKLLFSDRDYEPFVRCLGLKSALQSH